MSWRKMSYFYFVWTKWIKPFLFFSWMQKEMFWKMIMLLLSIQWQFIVCMLQKDKNSIIVQHSAHTKEDKYRRMSNNDNHFQVDYSNFYSSFISSCESSSSICQMRLFCCSVKFHSKQKLNTWIPALKTEWKNFDFRIDPTQFYGVLMNWNVFPVTNVLCGWFYLSSQTSLSYLHFLLSFPLKAFLDSKNETGLLPLLQSQQQSIYFSFKICSNKKP